MSNQSRHNQNNRRQRSGHDNRNANGRGGWPSPRYGGFSILQTLRNVPKDAVSLLQKWMDSPLRSINEIKGFYSNIVAFCATIATIFGYSVSSGSSNVNTSGQTSGLLGQVLSVFPARAMAFVIIAASIGWTISSFGIWLTSSRSPWSRPAGHFATLISAFFLAACIDWIFSPDLKIAPKLVLFCSIIGVALAVFLAKTNFKLTLEPDGHITMVRAEFLTTFAGSITILVLLREFTGL